MASVWDWVVQNKQWVFSGIGVLLFPAGWWLIKKLFGANKPTSTSGSNPQFNINVSPTISPTISPNLSNTQTTSASDSGKQSSVPPAPDIRALTYKAAFAQGIGAGKSCFIMSFRNDGWADATNVIAHIAYSGSPSQKFLVDYGGWIEHQPVMNIPRGHTKNLIIGVTEDRKNFAVNDIGPATNYTRFELVEVGEITPGEWKMIATLSADNFRRDYVFDLTVGPDGSFLCSPEGAVRPPREQGSNKLHEDPQPNVASLRPEITTVVYDEESDVWSKGTSDYALSAALLPFSNEARKLEKTASVEGIRARITYYEFDGVEEFKRIDSGCWVGEAYRYADLQVGDIAYLIAAIQRNRVTAVLENPRHSVAGYSDDRTNAEEISAGVYEVKVDLVAGDHGEYAETYWFQLDVGEQLQVKRINQRRA